LNCVSLNVRLYPNFNQKWQLSMLGPGVRTSEATEQSEGASEGGQ
jgi:hypothetical protein